MYAFPVDQNTQEGVVQSPGMTLLDYFAGQAIAGVVLRAQPGTTIGQMVTDAYNIALAMDKHRETL